MTEAVLNPPADTDIKTGDEQKEDLNPITNITSQNGSDHLEIKGDELNVKMVWNKKTYEMKVGFENTVLDFRNEVKRLTGIPVNMQKIMYKGLVKDDSLTLKQVKLTEKAKVMVVGSTAEDVEQVKTTLPQQIKAEALASATTTKEPLCKQKIHKKVLDKGKPDDVPVGIKGRKDSLPPAPLSGFINKAGGKVRLTFKLEVDQLWLGTKERTEKLPMSSIRNVISEPIEGHEEYHILGLQLGPTEASRYWLYWFPQQYVDAVKDTILGKWQGF